MKIESIRFEVQRLPCLPPLRGLDGKALEEAGIDGEDLVLYGRYQCPECSRVVTVPERHLGMTFPACVECRDMKGKVVIFDLIDTFYKSEEAKDDENQDW